MANERFAGWIVPCGCLIAILVLLAMAQALKRDIETERAAGQETGEQ